MQWVLSHGRSSNTGPLDYLGQSLVLDRLSGLYASFDASAAVSFFKTKRRPQRLMSSSLERHICPFIVVLLLSIDWSSFFISMIEANKPLR